MQIGTTYRPPSEKGDWTPSGVLSTPHPPTGINPWATSSAYGPTPPYNYPCPSEYWYAPFSPDSRYRHQYPIPGPQHGVIPCGINPPYQHNHPILSQHYTTPGVTASPIPQFRAPLYPNSNMIYFNLSNPYFDPLIDYPPPCPDPYAIYSGLPYHQQTFYPNPVQTLDGPVAYAEELVIKSDQDPHLNISLSTWRREPISLSQVLCAIHKTMQTDIGPSEWGALSKEQKQKVRTASRERYKIFPSHGGEGRKMVDYHGSNVIFDGLTGWEKDKGYGDIKLKLKLLVRQNPLYQ